MKNNIFLLLSATFLLVACKKTPQMLPTQMFPFEIVNQNGQSLVHSKSDVVTISYTKNGMTQSFNAVIRTLYGSPADTSASKKYNGLYLSDETKMGDAVLNPNLNTSHTFSLSLNGVSLGRIYLDYNGYINTYPAPSSAALMFNDLQVVNDRSAGVVVVNLFQVNQTLTK